MNAHYLLSDLCDLLLLLLVSLSLQIHGDTLMRHASLLSAVQRLQRRLRGTWLRLDELLQNVRCMVDFIGNAQQ